MLTFTTNVLKFRSGNYLMAKLETLGATETATVGWDTSAGETDAVPGSSSDGGASSATDRSASETEDASKGSNTAGTWATSDGSTPLGTASSPNDDASTGVDGTLRPVPSSNCERSIRVSSMPVYEIELFACQRKIFGKIVMDSRWFAKC